MKIKLVLILQLLASLPLILAAQWHKRDINYTQHHFYNTLIPEAIHFSDSQNGYIVSDDNILKYNGKRWKMDTAITSDSLSTI